jgi:S-adenosylmethionine/arginine decarboxylase-like enzyme
MVGKHCILELYNCDAAKLDDEAFLRNAITTAAKRAGATLLNLITHRFDPQGVTGLALLAELDPIRQQLLLEAVGEGHQCLVSATHLGAFSGGWHACSQVVTMQAGNVLANQ